MYRLQEGIKTYSVDIGEGASLLVRHIPPPVYNAFEEECRMPVRDGRLPKDRADWTKLAAKVLNWGIIGWRGVYHEDGETPAEFSEDKILLLGSDAKDLAYIEIMAAFPKVRTLMAKVTRDFETSVGSSAEAVEEEEVPHIPLS